LDQGGLFSYISPDAGVPPHWPAALLVAFSMISAAGRSAVPLACGAGNGSYNTVLVEVDEIDNLKAAYPNYFGDVDLFKQKLIELAGGSRVPLNCNLSHERHSNQRSGPTLLGFMATREGGSNSCTIIGGG
jgi:hypothetical protein